MGTKNWKLLFVTYYANFQTDQGWKSDLRRSVMIYNKYVRTEYDVAEIERRLALVPSVFSASLMSFRRME